MISSKLSSNLRLTQSGSQLVNPFILKVGGSRIVINQARKATSLTRRRNPDPFFSELTRSNCSGTRIKGYDGFGSIGNSIRTFSSSRIDAKEKGKEKEQEKEKTGIILNVTKEHREKQFTVGQILEGESEIVSMYTPLGKESVSTCRLGSRMMEKTSFRKKCFCICSREQTGHHFSLAFRQTGRRKVSLHF